MNFLTSKKVKEMRKFTVVVETCTHIQDLKAGGSRIKTLSKHQDPEKKRKGKRRVSSVRLSEASNYFLQREDRKFLNPVGITISYLNSENKKATIFSINSIELSIQ